MIRFLAILAALSVLGLSGFMLYVSHKKEIGSQAEMYTLQHNTPSSPVGKCMNMGGALEAPKEGDWGYRIRERDFHTLREAGFDTVRIPIKWSNRTDQNAPYKINPRLLKRVGNVVDQANGAGLNVIINVHHYDKISQNADAELPRLYAIWDQIIEYFRYAPDTVMFEFLNEPHTDMTPARVDEVNRALLAKVRAVNPDRWVVLGGGEWGTLNGLLATNPPRDERAITTFHYYSPFEFTHQGAPWAHKKVPLGQTWGTSADRKAMASDFSKAARWRDRTGMPLLLGEFGVYTKVPDVHRAAWTEQVRQTAETVGFSWCYWDFATSLQAYDTATEQFRPGMLEALTGDGFSQVQ
jgi:endoglucanase